MANPPPPPAQGATCDRVFCACADCDATTTTTYRDLGEGADPRGRYMRDPPPGWAIIDDEMVCPACLPKHIPGGAILSAPAPLPAQETASALRREAWIQGHAYAMGGCGMPPEDARRDAEREWAKKAGLVRYAAPTPAGSLAREIDALNALRSPTTPSSAHAGKESTVRCVGCGRVAEPVVDNSSDGLARGAYCKTCNAAWTLAAPRVIWGPL